MGRVDPMLVPAPCLHSSCAAAVRVAARPAVCVRCALGRSRTKHADSVRARGVLVSACSVIVSCRPPGKPTAVSRTPSIRAGGDLPPEAQRGAVLSSFGGKAPPGHWATLSYRTILAFCVNGVSPPRYSRSVAPQGGALVDSARGLISGSARDSHSTHTHSRLRRASCA